MDTLGWVVVMFVAFVLVLVGLAAWWQHRMDEQDRER